MVTLLGYIMTWFRALKYASAITVTSVLVASTLITNVLSAIFVTHAWTELMGVQAVLMIVGVMMFWFAAKKEVGADNKNLSLRDSL
jgi:glucose uptake protein GlcU